MTSNIVLFCYRSKLGLNLHLQPSLLEFEDVINIKFLCPASNINILVLYILKDFENALPGLNPLFHKP